MPDTIKIRFAMPEDAAAIVSFNKSMAKETENLELDEEILSAGVKALFNRPELGFYIVAETEGRIAGSLMITTEWSDWRNGIFWWVQSVYVRPEFRRQGIYRALYDFTRKKAEKKPEVKGFRLYVEKNNTTACKTYESLGMNETYYRMYEQLK